MNNRGQTLTIFIILIPVLFMLLGVIIDISYATYEKRNVENNIKYTVRTSFSKNLDEQQTIELIKKNIKNIEDYKVYHDNDALYVYIKTKVNGIFSNLFSNPIKNIEVTYKGTFDGDNIIVERG